MNKKVLITGGAGFIGSNLALGLIEKGYNVRVMDNMSQQIHGENYEESELFKKINGKVDFMFGDVRDEEKWNIAIKDVDYIVHLAAETGTGQSMYEIKKYSDVNITGTSLMLDILANKKHNIKKIIVASSRAIYGEGRYKCENHGIVFPLARIDENMTNKDFNIKCPICNENCEALSTTEDSKIHPTSIYGFTKYAQEEMCMITGKAIKLPVVALRYQNVYGPGQSLKNPYTGILSIFSTRIKNGNNINVFEDGLESRDFIYIDDVVGATILCIENNEVNYERLNIGTGISTSVKEVAEILKKKYNGVIDIMISNNYRLGDIRHNFADITKIKSKTGFSPKYDFESGISKFVEWVNTQKIENDNYDKSIEEMKRKGLYK